MEIKVKKDQTIRNMGDWKKINHLLESKDKSKYVIILILSLISGFLQSISVASFMPFINMLLDVNSIQNNTYIKAIYDMGHFTSTNQFVVAVGITVAFMFLISNGTAIITSWMKNKFILFTAHGMSKRLLKNYLYKPYEFILYKNTAELNKNILNDVFELTNGYLNGILDLIINIIMIAVLIIMLMVVNIKTTLIILAFFLLTYGVLMLLSKSKLKTTGEKAIIANMNKYKFSNEALNSFKISKSLGIEDFLVDRFDKVSKKHAKYRLFAKTIQEVPKYIMDAFIFSGLSLVITMFIIRGNNIDKIIPMISLYTIAGYRIMPEVAKIFTSFSSIAHNRPVLDKLYSEIQEDSSSISSQELLKRDRQTTALTFNHSIQLENVSFNYQKVERTLSDICLTIDRGTIVGFAGTTGAGKTTLIDILLGLLVPQSGSMKVDQVEISKTNVRAWQSLIGYVPQDIYLIDDTIQSNIAFGIPESEIDVQRVKVSAQIASIADLIERELPEGYQTQIGERGVRLSGGQRQRLGLARALYRNPEILILDEATSALDGATEESVISRIVNDSSVKTIIIIAHRLNTLKVCNRILILDRGIIADEGSYDELYQHSDKFRKMAKIEKA